MIFSLIYLTYFLVCIYFLDYENENKNKLRNISVNFFSWHFPILKSEDQMIGQRIRDQKVTSEDFFSNHTVLTINFFKFLNFITLRSEDLL